MRKILTIAIALVAISSVAFLYSCRKELIDPGAKLITDPNAPMGKEQAESYY